MPKLLFTIHSPSVYGAGRMASIFALDAMKNGFDVEFAYGKDVKAGERRITDELREVGVPIHFVPNMAMELSPLGQKPLTEVVRGIGADIVASSQLRDVAPAMFAAKRAGVPGLAVCMNLPHFRGNPFVVGLKRWLYSRAVREHAAHVVAVSPAIKDYFLTQYSVADRSVTVVPCALNLEQIPVVEPEVVSKLKEEFGLHEDHFVVVNIARFHRQKGQDVLVEAIAKLKSEGHLPANLRFLLVGGCEDKDAEAMLGKIKQDIANAGISDQVILTGFRDDYRSFLHISDVFVLPSRWEGLPLVVLEAFAAKVPVIMTDYGKRFEGFRDGADGFYVQVGDSSALATAIQRVAALGDEERKRVGECGYQYLVDNLSLERSLQQFNGILRSLLRATTISQSHATT